MTKRELALLERAWCREIESAFDKLPHLMQTRSKLADRLVADGLLARATVTLGGRFPVKIEGYELTHAGRYVYCASCADGAAPGGK